MADKELEKVTPADVGSISPFEGGGGIMKPADQGQLRSIFDEYIDEGAGVDVEGYAETEEPVIYCGIRQKDLKEAGKTVRSAGGYRFGPTKKPSMEDFNRLVGILVASAEIRTRFADPNDQQPECGSKDMIQADQRDGFGYKDKDGNPMKCADCVFNRHGKNFNGNTTTHCRENLQFFIFELQLKEVICVQYTPGARKAWRDFSSKVRRSFREAYSKRFPATEPPNEAPWITLILEIQTEWVDQKGGYYIPTFRIIGKLEKGQLERFREVRKDMADRIEITKSKAAQGAGMDAEDVMGRGAVEADYEVVK